MDSREEEDQRGLRGNLLGAAGVMVGSFILLIIVQWAPLLRMLLTPAYWVLVFLCFQLGSLMLYFLSI